MKETGNNPTDYLYQNPSLSLLTTSLQASSIRSRAMSKSFPEP